MKTVRGWAFPDADEFMANELADDGTYQASHLRLAEHYITDWSCAVDGGAHVGTWSRLMSALFQRVIACEPSPDTCEALRANMARFQCANVEIRECALGATAGVVSIAPLEVRAAALKNTGARFVREGGAIPRLTLDSLALPSLGFLKLDVEGSEPLVIQGARETIARCRPIILFENKGLWQRFGLPKAAMSDALTALGYGLLAPAGRDAIWGPR